LSKLSIIIPVYNVEKYLPQCLDSVFLEQNLEDVEVICVNDGSPDNSRAILSEYAEKYENLLIVDRENGGLSAARNSGLDVAIGEYIYFLDSDDYLLPGSINKALRFAVENKTDISFFNAKNGEDSLYFYEKKPLGGIHAGKHFYTEYYRQNGFFPPSPVWLYIYHHTFLKSLRLRFKEGVVHEDEEFTPKAFYQAERVSALNIPLQYHRVLRDGAITAAFSERNLADIIGNLESVFSFLRNKHAEEPLFYHKLFLEYLGVAKKTASFYPGKKSALFSVADFERMKACAAGWDWYVYYWLFRYSDGLFRWYISDACGSGLKKGLNRCFKVYFKITGKA